MAKIKILTINSSPQKMAQARGKLFEKMMSDVLNQLGYEIDSIPNTNYSGMEIDIEGKLISMNNPLYAECKFYDTDIRSPKLQAFYGKYMAKWKKNKKSHGLFIAVPDINSHAKGFYKDYIETDEEINFKLL